MRRALVLERRQQGTFYIGPGFRIDTNEPAQKVGAEGALALVLASDQTRGRFEDVIGAFSHDAGDEFPAGVLVVGG